ncbi:MAG: hypothetical protein Q4E22_01870 [Coriobacteriia bacterium]|nr:hypothetical protein [Coriobacteriia bacterium]
MPALITHALMGENVLENLAHAQTYSHNERRAFLLGTQGPDPYFFRFSNLHATPAHHLAKNLHYYKIAEQFYSYYDALLYLDEADKPLGKAYLLGFLTHYSLDSLAHPFIYAQQAELIQASPDLSLAARELHSAIESDIDTSMLMHMHQYEVSHAYILSLLKAPREVIEIAGLLHAYVARNVYSLDIHEDEFKHSLADMRAIYHLVEDESSSHAQLASKLEQLIRKKSILGALAHRSQSDKTDLALNLEHHAWKDPYHRHTSHESFIDIFAKASEAFQKNCQVFLQGGPMEDISKHTNYYGQPLDESELFTLVENEDEKSWE